MWSESTDGLPLMVENRCELRWEFTYDRAKLAYALALVVVSQEYIRLISVGNEDLRLKAP